MNFDDAIDAFREKHVVGEEPEVESLREQHRLLGLEIQGNQQFIMSCNKLLREKTEQIADLVVKQAVIERRLHEMGDPRF